MSQSIQLPPPIHRKRTTPQSDLEAASSLKLGEDQNTHTLSLSEARLVINKVLENKRRTRPNYEEPEYVLFFRRFYQGNRQQEMLTDGL